MMQIRVYYEDTDFSGRVYHASYLRFAERGRTEFLRALGISHTALLQLERPLGFAVRRLACRFLGAAKIDDMLAVETELRFTGGASLELAQRISCAGDLLWRAVVEVVCIEVSTGRPARLPATIKRALPAAGKESYFAS